MTSSSSRLRDLEPAAPVVSYRRRHPGEMILTELKKLGRFSQVGHRITERRRQQGRTRNAGCEFVHVWIEDVSHIAFSQILPDERRESAVAFIEASIAYYARLGVTVTGS